MENFKVNRYLNNLEDNQKLFVLPLVNEFRKAKIFDTENFKGDSISFKDKNNEVVLKIGTKAVVLISTKTLDQELVIKVHKKLSYAKNSLKIIYNKTITPEILAQVVSLYK